MSEAERKRSEATVRDFLNVIFRYKLLILGIAGITTAVVIFLTASQPTVYVSTSRILVKRGEQSNAFTGYVRVLPWQEEMSSQIEVILSQAVFKSAFAVFADSIAGHPERAAFKFRPGAARAGVIGESNVFSVSYTGADPEECRLGCAALTEAYKEYYRKAVAPPPVSDFFLEETQDVLAELDFWRMKKNDFLSKEKFFGMTEEGSFHMSKLGNLELQLSRIKTDISSQEVRVKAFEELVPLSFDELENSLGLSSRGIAGSGIMTNIRYTLQNLRTKREELLNKYTDKHPDVVSVDNQIRDLQLDLKREVDNAYEGERGNLQEFQAEQRLLEAEIVDIRARLSTLPEKEMELSRIETKIRNFEDKYSLLRRRHDEAEINSAGTPEWEVTILSAASHGRRSKTKDYVRVMLGPFLSVIVAFGLAFFFESIDHSVKNASDVEQYLGHSVLATIAESRLRR